MYIGGNTMEQAPKEGIGILVQRYIQELSRSSQRAKMYKQRLGSVALFKAKY